MLGLDRRDLLLAAVCGAIAGIPSALLVRGADTMTGVLLRAAAVSLVLSAVIGGLITLRRRRRDANPPTG